MRLLYQLSEVADYVSQHQGSQTVRPVSKVFSMVVSVAAQGSYVGDALRMESIPGQCKSQLLEDPCHKLLALIVVRELIESGVAEEDSGVVFTRVVVLTGSPSWAVFPSGSAAEGDP